MRRSTVLSMLRHALVAAVAVVGIAACDQDEGEFCQFTSDCASGLTCNQSSHRCQAGTVITDNDGGVDAPLDAGTFIDAAIDATGIDATVVDAALAIDAP